VVRKRIQVDNYNELPKEKRPTEKMIWEGTPEEIDNWLDRVFSKKTETEAVFTIKDSEIEG